MVYSGSETSIYMDRRSSDYLTEPGAAVPIATIDNTNMNFLGRSDGNNEIVVT